MLSREHSGKVKKEIIGNFYSFIGNFYFYFGITLNENSCCTFSRVLIQTDFIRLLVSRRKQDRAEKNFYKHTVKLNIYHYAIKLVYSDWSRAFDQFTIVCELDMINAISAADIAFIMPSSTSAWLLSPLQCSPQKQNG